MESISESSELEKFSPLSDRRPFDVILRGGTPWGFRLAGGENEESPLHVSKIETGSQAEDSALLVGDKVMSVNGISCGGLALASQLIDSAFRTLTLTVLRGGWDASRGVRSQSSHLSKRLSSAAPSPTPSPRDTDSGHQQPQQSSGPPGKTRSCSLRKRHPQPAHDDSALYAQSKASQQCPAMKPSRPRRGDSFSVGKSKTPHSPSTSDPPWARAQPSAHAPPHSGYPEVRDRDRQPSSSSAQDRRYSDGPGRFQHKDSDYRAPYRESAYRDRRMVSAKSSPNLVKADQSIVGPVPSGVDSFPVKAVKSTPDIHEDVTKEGHNYRKRPSMLEQPMLGSGGRPLANYGAARYSLQDNPRGSGNFHRRSEKAKRYSEDMYTSDMNAHHEPHPSMQGPSLALQKYQPDYENVSALGTAPLQSEKISEIDDSEDWMCEGDQAPAIPPRPACGNDPELCCPTPPVRDPASLKYIKVNQNHEKYPSWPVTQANSTTAAPPDPQAPINTRAQSWTDHTNTHKEFPNKQRLAYQPGLRPLAEKNSPTGERKEDDGSEFTYDRYGKVIQKRPGDMKGRFEDFYHNSKPGYLPPMFDSDGHSYGDKEYSAPSPPERDVVGVDRHAVAQQALGTEAGEPRTQQPQAPQYKTPQQPQPQEPVRQTSHGLPAAPISTSVLVGRAPASTSSPYNSPPRHKRPAFLAAPTAALMDARRTTDSATSPLSPSAAPRSKEGEARGAFGTAAHRDYSHREPASADLLGNRASYPSGTSHKPFIVKQTPYYNTSTQTDALQTYAVKMSDSRPPRSVEVQGHDAGGQALPASEEKAVQARLSREFPASELNNASPETFAPADKRNFFQYPFEGMQSIHAKYATDEDPADSSERCEVFQPFSSGDQASIMRKLSEEFYGGNKMGTLGDKRPSASPAQEPSTRPEFSSTLSVYSGTMSQAESYASVVIHPSESAGPFGRDDFGSQSSIADSRQDLSAVLTGSRVGPRGRNSLEYFPRSAPRPLSEAKKFNSLTTISHHQRDRSTPVLSRYGTQSQESLCGKQADLSVDTRWRGSHPDSAGSGSVSEASSPLSQPHSVDSRGSGSVSNQLESPSYDSRSRGRGRIDSLDSVFNDPTPPDKSSNSAKTGSGESGGAAELGRKPSMKMAYGIYDESDKLLSKDSKISIPSSQDGGNSRSRGSHSDAKQLDQIQEEAGDSSQTQLSHRTSNLVRHTTQEDVSDTRLRPDSRRNDSGMRTGRSPRPLSEHLTSSSRDRTVKIYEPGPRPQRPFDGSMDSGVGSETGSTRASESQLSSLEGGSLGSTDLKRLQQQAVREFVIRKTGHQSLSTSYAEHSRESSMYESVEASRSPHSPHSPHSPTSESVSDLISKTNENLAKRADSFRRSSSTSSRTSSSDYMDMNRQERPYKETDWKRLRNSETFQYSSNRSSLCSENTYEDISVFPTPAPQGNDNGEGDGRVSSDNECEDGSKMDSGVMASSTYQNFPGDGSRRRPPPPLPRETPSHETRNPPPLPPRNYVRQEDEGSLSSDVAGEEADDGAGAEREGKLDVRGLVHQWENSSPREDAYAAQLRREAAKMTGGMRGSAGPTTAPSGMSVVSTRTQMTVTTSFKRQPMVAQEATTPSASPPSSLAATVSGVNGVVISPAGPAEAGTPPAPASSSTHGSLLHRRTESDAAAASALVSHNSSLSPSSAGGPPPPRDSPVGAFVDRNTKPVAASSGSRPPQSPQHPTLPPREDPNFLSVKAEYSRDRSGSDILTGTGSELLLRDRSSSDTRVVWRPDGSDRFGPGQGPRDSSGSPSGRRRKVPPLPDGPGGGSDLGELPPPPSELLNVSGSSFDKGYSIPNDQFADDSYGAYRNRGNRQVGTYARSSSAANIRPDNHHLKNVTDASAVFGDRRLGKQNWNSDSQLQSNRAREAVSSGGAANEAGGAPDRPVNVPAFKADSNPVRAVKMPGAQPLAPYQGQSGAIPREAKTFAAKPFHVEPPREESQRNGGDSSSPKQSRSVKSRVSNLERKNSFTSSPPSSAAAPPAGSSAVAAGATPSQRWANAAPFEATHRPGTDRSPQGNAASAGSVPDSRLSGLTNSAAPNRPAAERPPSGSPSADTTQNYVSSRPRAYSERVRDGGEGLPPATAHVSEYPQQHQRYAQVAPMASDARALPGHVRSSPLGSDNQRPRASPSPFYRRESAPMFQLQPGESAAAVAMVSPRRKSEGSFLTPHAEADKENGPHPGEMSVSHSRQPSQEELECDQRAQELAREVADSEKKLSDVLSADPTKKRMKYMNGLSFGDTGEVLQTPASIRKHQSQQGSSDRASPSKKSPALPGTGESPASEKRNSLPREYFMSQSKAVIEMEWRKQEETEREFTKNIHDSETLIKQKEELIEKLHKKLDLLREERIGLQEEIQQNDSLGKRVCDSVDTNCPNPNERDKFHTYIDDLEKIVRLLLNLSGQLARAENAVQCIAEDTDPRTKKMTHDKLERLQTKHAEAKQLKEDIDRRSTTVSSFLRQSLSAEELNDYAYFVRMKSKLTIDLQELEDKITLGQEQIQELKKSIPERPTVTQESAADSTASVSPRSSPSASPVPS